MRGDRHTEEGEELQAECRALRDYLLKLNAAGYTARELLTLGEIPRSVHRYARPHYTKEDQIWMEELKGKLDRATSIPRGPDGVLRP